MRILNICMGAPFTENYSYQDNLLTEYQKKHGHEVEIITTTRTRSECGKIINTKEEEKVLNNGVKLIRIKSGGKIRQFIGFYPQIRVEIDKFKPDLIFVHGLGSWVMNCVVSYKKTHEGVHVVADNHQDEGTTYTKSLPFALHLYFFKTMWKYWIKYVDKVYGTTSWRQSFANKYYGISTNKLDTLIMGVDTDRISQDKDDIKESLRKSLGIGLEDFVFVTGGKLDNRKKIIEAVRAFSKIKSDKISFLIFGSLSEDIQEEFESLCAKDSRIKYVGYIKSTEVYKYFFASDFGVFPGRHSVLWEEAIGCGLPCLLKRYDEKNHTDVCGNCLYITETTEKIIYEQLDRIVNDRDFYHDLKMKAEKAAESFSYHKIADKSVECITKGV